jgi:DNA polymerase III epsilon subunit-like protein
MSNYILGVDLETTGLLEPINTPLLYQPYIIEFCALGFSQQGDELFKHTSLVCPPIDIPGYITKITKIEQWMVSNKPAFRHFAAHLKELIERAELFVVQNGAFEKGVLDCEFARLDLKCEWPPIYCTVEHSKHFRGRRLKNEELLLETTGNFEAGKHRAEADIRQTMKAYFALRNDSSWGKNVLD